MKQIQERQDLELAFVWNRTKAALEGHVGPDLILKNLEDFPDLCVSLFHLDVVPHNVVNSMKSIG